MDLDRYTVSARLAPIALVLLPLALAAVAWMPDGKEGLQGLLGLGVWVGAAIALAGVARDAGKRLEPRLFEAWGGPPTTVYLRQRVAGPDPDLRADALDKLRRIYPELVPTVAEESASPADADSAYDKIVRRLREQTRDRTRFPVVFAENVSYGFRRNLLALKWWGVGLSALGLGSTVARLLTGDASQLPLVPVAAAVVTAAAGSFLLVVVRGTWVRTAGFRYAAALLAATEMLEPTQPSSPGR